MIEFDSVTKVYGTRTALDAVSFKINPGDFVFLIGPSGAGKSTVSKLLTREIMPTNGNIIVGEYDYSKLKNRDIPFLRRQIGVVYQDNKLLPDRTVAENIALSLEILNKPNPTITKTVEELLRVTDLSGKENMFPRQLSGGELQRVVIARALAMDPPLLFADEPTGNLDVQTAHQIIELLERINKEGTTVLMSTHDINLVKSMQKRVITLKQGKIETDSGAAPVAADPQPEEVAA